MSAIKNQIFEKCNCPKCEAVALWEAEENLKEMLEMHRFEDMLLSERLKDTNPYENEEFHVYEDGDIDDEEELIAVIEGSLMLRVA